ncbi:MAG: hypothetical protein HYV63_24095 [Candidatus Schekmanbacteria bacterium]|nr:hypothetical protein [Candidatus Schekmanbacteria bacterium]
MGYVGSIGCGSILSIFGLVMILGVVVSETITGADLAGLLIAGIVPLSFGSALVVHGGRKLKRRNQIRLEETVLRLATQHGGMVTPALVARDAPVSLAEASAILEDMSAKGHAELTPMEDGSLRYYFPGVGASRPTPLLPRF